MTFDTYIRLLGTETISGASKTAQNALNKLEGASSKVSGAFGRLKNAGAQVMSQLKSMATGWLGVAAAIAGVIKLAKDSVAAFMKQEQAENDLAVAMKNAATYTKENYEGLKQYASALQQVTTYGDEVTLSVMANLQSYGMEIDILKQAVKATMDLATAKKIDLRTASELVGKAFVGETGTLSRYGIVLGDNIEKGHKFEAVLGLINERFGGAAQADIETYAGQLKQLSNWWGDITEKIGFGLVKALEAVLVLLSALTTGFLSTTWAIVKVLSYIPFVGDAFKGAADSLARWSITTLEFTQKNWKMLTSNKEAAKSIKKQADATQQAAQAQKELNKAISSRLEIGVAGGYWWGPTPAEMFPADTWEPIEIGVAGGDWWGPTPKELFPVEPGMWDNFISGAQNAAKQWGDIAQQMEDTGWQVANSISSNLGDAFYDIVSGTKSVGDSFKDMAQAIVEDIGRIVTRMIAMQAVQTMMGGIGMMFGEGGIMPGHFEPVKQFAQGGVLPGPFMPITPMQHGGVYSRPTLGLIAEAGSPEAVVPLKGGAVPVRFVGDQPKAQRERPTYIVNAFSEEFMQQQINKALAQNAEVILNIVQQDIASQGGTYQLVRGLR